MKILHALILFSTIIFGLSCTHDIRLDCRTHRDYFIGWLDLNPKDYEKYGYSNQKDWERAISEANVILVVSIKKYFEKLIIPGSSPKQISVSYAEHPTEKPTKPSYYIKFTKMGMDTNANQMNIKVEIIDTTNNKTIVHFMSNAVGFGAANMYSFEGRLTNAAYALAYDVYYYLQDKKP